MTKRRRFPALLCAAMVLAAGACATNTGAGGGQAAEPGAAAGANADKVGFIFIGPRDDYGYNQAAFEGSQAVAKAFPDVEVLTAENVPEDDSATRTMESMVSKGAKIIFATSYGHKDFAVKVAAAHPDVVVAQQGNFITPPVPPNIGTYFGTVFEPVYLAGMAAGAATKSNTLGFVYAFPIPQTIANINAFARGAKRTNPAARVVTVNTSNWCDPAKQAEATKNLLGQGADVLTQHQDCTATVIRTAEAAGAMTVGYHADASTLAPKGWITGSEWNWGPVYTDIVRTIREGRFTGSQYNANYRAGCKTGTNPFVQSKFGPAVSEQTRTAIDAARTEICGSGSPFAGPVLDQSGTERIPAGTVPTYEQLETMDYFVDNVVGTIPKS